jgi:hypothetical protein
VRALQRRQREYRVKDQIRVTEKRTQDFREARHIRPPGGMGGPEGSSLYHHIPMSVLLSVFPNGGEGKKLTSNDVDAELSTISRLVRHRSIHTRITSRTSTGSSTGSTGRR